MSTGDDKDGKVFTAKKEVRGDGPLLSLDGNVARSLRFAQRGNIARRICRCRRTSNKISA